MWFAVELGLNKCSNFKKWWNSLKQGWEVTLKVITGFFSTRVKMITRFFSRDTAAHDAAQRLKSKGSSGFEDIERDMYFERLFAAGSVNTRGRKGEREAQVSG